MPWRGPPRFRATTLWNEENQNAVNHCRHPDRLVAPAACQLVHPGRIHSRPPGHRDRRAPDWCHSRSTRVRTVASLQATGRRQERSGCPPIRCDVCSVSHATWPRLWGSLQNWVISGWTSTSRPKGKSSGSDLRWREGQRRSDQIAVAAGSRRLHSRLTTSFRLLALATKSLDTGVVPV